MDVYFVILMLSFAYASAEDYCQSELFQPRCLRNEVILMENAVYGRMRIGRCIMAEEVAAHKRIVGDDPRYFVCSVDVLEILDRKCSGKAVCEIRAYSLMEDIQPCFPGLTVYLEANYSCITVLDEERSCIATASAYLTHIILSSFNRRLCGTKHQPWRVEAAVGHRITITLFSLGTRHLTNTQTQTWVCKKYGAIIDKGGKRNISICANELQRETALYNSTGNVLDIILYSDSKRDSNDNTNVLILKLKAFGCSNIIPPEDSWLKRNGDRIIIGCYESSNSWQLICVDGKWTGSIGNCTYYGGLSGKSPHTETVGPNDTNDEWRNSLIIVCVAMASLVISALIITFGVCACARFRKSYQREKDKKVKRAQKKVTFARNSQDAAVLNTMNPNIRPQPTAHKRPMGHRKPDFTSSMPNIMSNVLANNSTTINAIISGRNKRQTRVNYEIIPLNWQPGSTAQYLVPNESNYDYPYLDISGNFRQRSPIRSQELNSTSGYLLPIELRSQDIADCDTIHPSDGRPDADPESGYLLPNKFKHDYLDIVDESTLPQGRPTCNRDYLQPNELRSQSRPRDNLDLIEYEPCNSSFKRRRHSDQFSGYLIPSEIRQHVYSND